MFEKEAKEIAERKMKDFYTFEDVIRIMLYGSNKEKEILLANMVHNMNERLEHLEKTLKKSIQVEK